MAEKPGFLYYSTLLMTLLYFIAGVFLIVAPKAEEMLPGHRHIVLGILLILYGIFRIFRLRKIRKATYNED